MAFRHGKARGLGLALLVVILAGLIYGHYGFSGVLGRDEANHLYAGQRMAEGVPPYVSIFNIKTPLASMIAGGGAIVAGLFDWDDIFAVRVVFFLISCLTVVSVYLLGRSLFRSESVGILSALTFLCFFPYAIPAASGPEPKTPMVLFQTLGLLFTVRRDWFWAGLFGSLAFLTWQAAALFPLVTLIVAGCQGDARGRRLRPIASVLAGICLPVILIGVYFYRHDALYDLLDGSILFNLTYLDRGESSFFSHVGFFLRSIFRNYKMAAVPIMIGFAALASFYPGRRMLYVSWKEVLTKDRFAAVLLSFPAPVIWSLFDYQGYPDSYVFLPYLAIGFGQFLNVAVQRKSIDFEKYSSRRMPTYLALGVGAALVALAAFSVHYGRESGLELQKRGAEEIVRRYGADARVVSIGKPQLLVILHKTNPNRYVFVTSGIDRHIDAGTTGGFDGWLAELEAYDPDVIAVGRIRGKNKIKLLSWLKSHYQRERIEPWKLYVRPNRR